MPNLSEFCLSYRSAVMNLKGEMSMLNVLHLEEMDVNTIAAELQKKRDEMPQFFMQSPIVVDCISMGDDASDFDFLALKEALLKLNFIPIGVRNIPSPMNAALAKAGWAVMRESRKAQNAEPVQETKADTNDQASETVDQDSQEQNTDQSYEQSNEEAPVVEEMMQATTIKFNSLTVDRPVRSGQQIYAADSDMTVLAQTSAGSEIMADGSIHVYGALRGRVLAGAMGNESARIYCQSLQAELIAIAGRYQLLDESDTQLIGKPAMIKLMGEKLIIEPLSA